jgi:hypothetical protein
VKVVVEKEKELVEAIRITTKLAEKEAIDKYVEEARKKKNADEIEGETHTKNLDFPRTSIVGAHVEEGSNDLGLGP